MVQPDQSRLKAIASLKLTPREAEVLLWMSEGKSNHDIGVILNASTNTICKHVHHILTKLNVENRTTAAVIALEACGFVVQRRKNRSAESAAAVATLIAPQLFELWSAGWEICDSVAALIA